MVGVNVAVPECAWLDDGRWPFTAVCMADVSKVLRLRLLYRDGASDLDVTAMSSTLPWRCSGACCVDAAAALPLAAKDEAPNCGDTALGVALPDSALFAAGRSLYLSGEALAGASNEVRDRSGTLEDRLINDPFREPMTESSLADGCEDASDDVVDEAEAD